MLSFQALVLLAAASGAVQGYSTPGENWFVGEPAVGSTAEHAERAAQNGCLIISSVTLPLLQQSGK